MGTEAYQTGAYQLCLTTDTCLLTRTPACSLGVTSGQRPQGDACSRAPRGRTLSAGKGVDFLSVLRSAEASFCKVATASRLPRARTFVRTLATRECDRVKQSRTDWTGERPQVRVGSLPPFRWPTTGMPWSS